ncbi:MAG: glycosyltransferase family 39 protein, partial [Elusimicrobia bacterium]|nr:glycosyltransferase family 39 protein [Elusimicrobiota bacterium]
MNCFAIPHEYRVPIYSILINIFNIITPYHCINLLCVFQFSISLISIFYLYKILGFIGNNKRINLIIVFIYSVSNCIYSWDKTILTESLSLSLTIFIIYNFISHIKTKKYSYLFYMLLFETFGIFLKPVMATLIFATIIFFILNYKFYIKSLLLTFIPCIIVLLYATVFYFNYGIFSISNSHLANNLDIFVNKTNFYQLGFNKDMINIIDNAKDINSQEYKEYLEIDPIVFLGRNYKYALNKKYTNKEILNFINKIKYSYPNEIIKYIYYNLEENISEEFIGYGYFGNKPTNKIFNIFPIYIWEVLLISAVLLISLLLDFSKKYKLNELAVFTFLNISLTFSVLVLGNVNIEM